MAPSRPGSSILSVGVMLLAPGSYGLVARGGGAVTACRACSRAQPPVLTLSALPQQRRARPAAQRAEPTRGTNSFGRTLSAIALALMLIVPPLPSMSTPAMAEPAAAAKPAAASRRYINLTGFPFPLGPFTERRTVQSELVPGKVYGFEQEQQLSGITANVRSVVFRMSDNHLLVYNPVAPTDEFLQQLAELKSDGVSHILLGATAYEHKIFVGPFARKFPDAKVWAVPDQWAFPLDLPPPLLGIDTKGSGGGDLVDTAKGSAAYANAPDLTSEFEVKLLRPAQRLGFGYAADEAALFHRETKTLALTDALVRVQSTPPEIYDRGDLLDVGDNRRGTNTLGNIILKAAGAVNWRGTAAREVEALWAATDASRGEATASALQRGWERNALLSLYFGPSPSTLVDPGPSFQSLTNKWIVAPVTDSLIYRSGRVKPELTRWVNDLAQWDFNTIAPAHFAAGPGTADDLKAAFAPTLRPEPRAERAPYSAGDVALLDDIAEQLVKLRII